jgi:hypothetical protein
LLIKKARENAIMKTGVGDGTIKSNRESEGGNQKKVKRTSDVSGSKKIN